MKNLTLAILLALVAGGGYYVYTRDGGYGYSSEISEAAPVVNWVAAAPGRVEPKSGDIRLGTTLLGRVEEVLVKVDDKVEEGELLIRLDDSEARARLTSAAISQSSSG